MKNRLPPLIIALGFVSLFTDIANEMMVPVLPVFLSVTLGASAIFVGLIEGVAKGVAAILKDLGGVSSDADQTRRKWIFGGSRDFPEPILYRIVRFSIKGNHRPLPNLPS